MPRIPSVVATRHASQNLRAMCAFLIVGTLVSSALAYGAMAAAGEQLDRRALHADLRSLASELPKHHVAPFHRVSRRSFENEVASLDRQIDRGIGPDQVFVGMSRIVSSIGDGHTMMPNPVGAPLFGLRFAKFGEDYRLIGTVAGGAGAPALGGRLKSVGGIPIARVERLLMQLTPADETLALREGRVAALLDRGIVLYGLQLTNDRNAARFELLLDDGRVVTIEARATAEVGSQWLTAARGSPLSSRNPDQSLGCTSARPRSLYCNFRSYDRLEPDVAQMFDEIARDRPKRLILDLRQNGGGNFCKGLKYLIMPLAARSDFNRRGGLYVLIGPETFSAAMSNSAHFRQLTRAILVGQPIGEIPNSYQEVDKLTLPNSRWVVRYSTRFYRFAPGQKNLIEPDKFIPRTWADYRNGRDGVLDWVLAQPLQGSLPAEAAVAAKGEPAEGHTCATMP